MHSGILAMVISFREMYIFNYFFLPATVTAIVEAITASITANITNT